MASTSFSGFIAGVSVGLVIGIMFAPDKGSGTRKKISDKTGDFTDSVKKSFGEFIDKIKDSVRRTSTEAGEFVERDYSAQPDYAGSPTH